MSDESRIATRLTSNLLTCKLTADRTVHPGEPVYFPSPDKAKGSWLAEKLFTLRDVTAVKIAGDMVSLTRGVHNDWPEVTRPAAAAMREVLAKGLPAVALGTPSNIPSTEDIRRKVEEILAAEINPAVAGHGGFIELIEVKGQTVYLRLGGGCQGCGMANVTLKQGVERAFRDAIPELDEILDNTDHASGTNPYYAPSKK